MNTVSELRISVGGVLGHDMRGYQLYNLGCAVDEIRDDNETAILKDYSIKNGSTLVTMKKGQVLDVPNAKVSQLSYESVRPFQIMIFVC